MLVDWILLVVDVRDEVPDPALGIELVPLLTLALINQHDPQALGQESGLAQALNEDLGRPLELVEDLEVGKERNRRARLLRGTDLLQVGGRLATRELLMEDLAVAPNLDLKPLGEGVDDRHADAVQSA